jgi:NAD(P)-dependent dehydrogenase (short-subunit alcohol dehydrogenase family)
MGIFDLQGQRALVLGTGGIGGAIAYALAEAGTELVLADAREENLAFHAGKIARTGRGVVTIRREIRNRDDIVSLYEEVDKVLPDITLSVNTIGLSVMAPALETTQEQWDTVLRGFLDNVFWSNQQAARIMRRNKRGKILNLASMSGIVVTGDRGASYAAAKAGVIQLTRALAMEWIKNGIYVNSISPGTVDTALTASFLSVPEVRKEIERDIPLGRVAVPADIVGPALFLLSPASDYVVGQNIIVDGGYTVR